MTNNNSISIFETLAKDINDSSLSEQGKQKMLSNLAKMHSDKVTLMITGAPGSGKKLHYKRNVQQQHGDSERRC